MTLGEVQKVLQQLLREQVSIRDLGTILERWLKPQRATRTRSYWLRQRGMLWAAHWFARFSTRRGSSKWSLSTAALEEECARSTAQNAQIVTGGAIQISVARRVLDGLRAMLGDQIAMAPPVLLCSSPGRFYLRRILEPFIPKIVVISPSEIPPMTQVMSLGSVR